MVRNRECSTPSIQGLAPAHSLTVTEVCGGAQKWCGADQPPSVAKGDM
jgi:hypothetical protein